MADIKTEDINGFLDFNGLRTFWGVIKNNFPNKPITIDEIDGIVDREESGVNSWGSVNSLGSENIEVDKTAN